jgi:hypothetical protein
MTTEQRFLTAEEMFGEDAKHAVVVSGFLIHGRLFLVPQMPNAQPIDVAALAQEEARREFMRLKGEIAKVVTKAIKDERNSSK